MKYKINLFLIVAFISIAAFMSCREKDSESSSSFGIDQSEIDVPSEGGVTLISVNSAAPWNVSVDADWLTLSSTSGSGSQIVTVTVAKLEDGPRRTATVSFTSGGTVATASVVQRGNLVSDYYGTGDIIRLHRHTEGEGIAIVFIGDGFDREDCRKGGFYEEECRKLADLFLSMPVYRDFKQYFDISARVDVSRDRGVRNCVDNPDKCPNNAYLSGHPQIDFGKAQENAKLTAGKNDYWFIFMGNGQIGGYAMGNFAVYSTVEGLKPYWMMHEFAGHAFGNLPDLYYIWLQGVWKEEYKEWIDKNHENGELFMFDGTKDPKEVFWKTFIGRNGYEMVGIYPGGYYDPPLAFGEIQTCEAIGNCVMNGPVAHYSVMERFQIWRRIQLRAGFPVVTEDEFIKYDVVNIIDANWTWEQYNNWQDDRSWVGDWDQLAPSTGTDQYAPVTE